MVNSYGVRWFAAFSIPRINPGVMYSELLRSFKLMQLSLSTEKFRVNVSCSPTEFYAYEGFAISVKIRG